MKPADFDIEELIDSLQGTCATISEKLPEEMEEDLTEQDHDAIDNRIFRCETCSWWCEVGEEGDEKGNCNDCVEPEEDE